MDENTEPLAGPYSLTTDYEGFSRVIYGNPWFPKPLGLIGQLDSTGVAGHYLVVCQDEMQRYYLLSLTVENEQQAQTSLLGPLNRTACRRQLYQLTGDSTLRLSPTPR